MDSHKNFDPHSGPGGQSLNSPTQDWQRASTSNAAVFLRCLRNTFRLATGPREVMGLLQFLSKAVSWRLRDSPDAERDQTLRLHGVTHVLGLGTGELFNPQEIYWERGYERLPEFVPKSGWIVVDVGANIGVYTVQQARRGAWVYAFEPNPGCYRRLRKAVRANDLESQVTAVNCALGAEPGSAELLLPGELTTMGSLRPEWTPADGQMGLDVEVDTIDRVAGAHRIQRIDLLKIDVEGLEFDVLQGAIGTLPLVHRVIIEYHSRELGKRVSELLTRYGLTTELDDEMYHGDENLFKGVGRGLLFARRTTG